MFNGADDDCSGTIPIAELDCDGDGSFAILSTGLAFGAELDRPSRLGLASCVPMNIKNPSIYCWSDNYDIECDEETGLWVLELSNASDQFTNAALNKRSSTCDLVGDCDDQCASRCPGVSESCDGIDNDCDGGYLFDADVNGVPDAMEREVQRWGLVSESEMDLDGDSYITCTSYPADNPVYRTAATCRDIVSSDFLGDCNDLCALASPEADEACDGFLNTCNGEGEGLDNDADGHLTCGAFSGDSSLVEYAYLLAWVAAGSVAGPETGILDTAFADTAGEPWDDSGDDWDTVAKGRTAVAPPALGESGWQTIPLQRLPVVPLLVPRMEAPECDSLLRSQISMLVGKEQITQVVDGEVEPLLNLCIEADRCRLQAAGSVGSDGGKLDPACAQLDGQCTVLRVTISEHADDDLLDEATDNLDYDGAEYCLEHPEQMITRTVWHQDRLLAARELVAHWECYRLYGSYGCSLEEPKDWRSPYGSQVPVPGGHFANPDPTGVLATETHWWMEMGRFNPVSVSDGILAGCWEDDIRSTLAQARPPVHPIDRIWTGGDCGDADEEAHRGVAEGPGDLLGYFFGASAACSTCLDGVDNNCNGLTDCAEPACADCFVGLGLGCGGGSESPCAQVGCASPGVSRPAPAGGAVLILLALLGAGWRGRRDSA